MPCAGRWPGTWQHPGLPGIDLLRARYVTHHVRQTHPDFYTIALVESEIEDWRRPRPSAERASPGGMPIVNPGTLHTAGEQPRLAWSNAGDPAGRGLASRAKSLLAILNLPALS
jgi:hypothetical protein